MYQCCFTLETFQRMHLTRLLCIGIKMKCSLGTSLACFPTPCCGNLVLCRGNNQIYLYSTRKSCYFHHFSCVLRRSTPRCIGVTSCILIWCRVISIIYYEPHVLLLVLLLCDSQRLGCALPGNILTDSFGIFDWYWRRDALIETWPRRYAQHIFIV